MTNLLVTRRVAALLALALNAPELLAQQPAAVSASSTPGAGKAEYAIRWNPKHGGPKSAAKTLEVLRLTEQDKDAYEIQYFTVTRPSDTPKGFEPIVRERIKKKKVELTYKFRGTTPLPASPSLNEWQCPLTAANERKDEADISFTKLDQTKKVYSRSCSVESKDAIELPASLNAKAKGCKSSMTRLKAKGTKVEEWRLADGTVLIEVSRNGDDNAADLQAFRSEVVGALVAAGAAPLDRSKSELGSECK